MLFELKKTIWLVAASLMLLALPTTGAQAFTGCDVRTQRATEIGDYYFVTLRNGELWRESNGIPGLQIGSTVCDGGVRIAEDTCLVFNPTGGLYAQTMCISPTLEDPMNVLP